MNQDRRGWWGRNWKWAAPGGCLLVVLLAFGGCVAMFAGVFGMIKNTGAYTQAIERVQKHPDAIAVLGEPITVGWMMQGNFNEDGATGEANYSVPVSGPRGSGTLYIEARKSAGQWRFDVLSLVPEGGGEPIDLLAPGEGSGRGVEDRGGDAQERRGFDDGDRELENADPDDYEDADQGGATRT